MARMYELRQKEVINTKDGSRYGFVNDVEIDLETGTIKSIIVPGPAKMFGVFGRETEYKIAWSDIKQLGEDIIIVEVNSDKVLKELESK